MTLKIITLIMIAIFPLLLAALLKLKRETYEVVGRLTMFDDDGEFL